MSSLPPPLDRLWRLFLSGLVAVLPVAVTLYLVLWILTTAESFFGAMTRLVLPDSWYLPGLGLLTAIGVILLAGAVLKAWLIDRLFHWGVSQLERIPLVKTVYIGVRDLMTFISRSDQRSDLGQVVLVEIQPEFHVIGFVTDRDPASGIPELAAEYESRVVAVYMPMGYQIGGYTLYLPEHRLKPVDLSVEDALRVVLTANVNRPQGRDSTPQRPDGPS